MELFPNGQPQLQKRNISPVSAHPQTRQDGIVDRDSPILLQPEPRPTTQEQLVNEVKGIYAGLNMVQKKCVEIDQQQAATTNKLTNLQWQALIAMHRTLLHEHHEFFLTSQYPSSSPTVKRLATKYAMSARMWRHGIYSLLELLIHQLPDSSDDMFSLKSDPTFEETSIDCLGDLGKYRMALGKCDIRDRERWVDMARTWYDQAADQPFTPLASVQTYPGGDSLIGTVLGTAPIRGLVTRSIQHLCESASRLDGYRLEFRDGTQLLCENTSTFLQIPFRKSTSGGTEWEEPGSTSYNEVASGVPTPRSRAIRSVIVEIGDKNVIAFMYVKLVFLLGLSLGGRLLADIEDYVPWSAIASFLKTVGRSSPCHVHNDSEAFPKCSPEVSGPLTDAIPMRCLAGSKNYSSLNLFNSYHMDKGKHASELPSENTLKAQPCSKVPPLTMDADAFSKNRMMDARASEVPSPLLRRATKLPCRIRKAMLSDLSEKCHHDKRLGNARYWIPDMSCSRSLTILNSIMLLPGTHALPVDAKNPSGVAEAMEQQLLNLLEAAFEAVPPLCLYGIIYLGMQRMPTEGHVRKYRAFSMIGSLLPSILPDARSSVPLNLFATAVISICSSNMHKPGLQASIEAVSNYGSFLLELFCWIRCSAVRLRQVKALLRPSSGNFSL